MDLATEPPTDFTVIGAGIVGVCCAAFLRREGFSVTLIDRDEPGRGCSFGNAGNFSIGSVAPNSMPGIAWKLPTMLADPLHPLHLDWRYMANAAPFFWRFLRNSRRERVHAIAPALHALLSQVFESYEMLLGATLNRTGKLYTYERAGAYEADGLRYELQDRFGVRREVLDGGAARELEPALSQSIIKAVFWPDYGWTANPFRLTSTIVQDFIQHNGLLRRADVREIELGADGPAALVTDKGRLSVDRLVIAAGAWSKSFAAQLGTRVCLDGERGYHLSLPSSRVVLGRTIMSHDRFISATPMEDGLRVSGVAEFTGLAAPPRMELTEQVLHHAKALFPDLDATGALPWMGVRPSTPDSLPILGRAPKQPKVLFAFGHFGLTLGAISGRLIAELAAGRPTTLDLSPYRADRF
jgi:D-amino-acid dehydrogenase